MFFFSVPPAQNNIMDGFLQSPVNITNQMNGVSKGIQTICILFYYKRVKWGLSYIFER